MTRKRRHYSRPEAPDPARHPMLCALLASGAVWVDEYQTFLGRASDGVVVQLGAAWFAEDFDRINAYLVEHPTPDTWCDAIEDPPAGNEPPGCARHGIAGCVECERNEE